MLEKLFKLRENGTDVRTEVMAGITTFMTMAYILCNSCKPEVSRKCRNWTLMTFQKHCHVISVFWRCHSSTVFQKEFLWELSLM